MSEFKLKCWYKLNDKQQIWNDKEPRVYHRFFVANFRELPPEYFSSQEGLCSIWVADWLLEKNIKNNLKLGCYYQFIVKLGESKTAHFKHKYGLKGGKIHDNNMILKTKEYFKNTVQKIGFWDSKNCFYEVKEESKKPTSKPNNNSTKSENKGGWGKIALICLPIIIFAFFIFLAFRRMSKKNK